MLGLAITTIAILGAQFPEVQVFEGRTLSDAPYEAASVFDVNNDGFVDIVSGAFWYEGPDFQTRHEFRDLPPMGEYYDDFSNYPMDVDEDGWTDIITGGFFGGPLRWVKNPGDSDGPWEDQPIKQVGNIERTFFYDLDGDGQVEIMPNCPGHPVRVFKRTGPGQFAEFVVREEAGGHGQGAGDINGDGRPDIILNNGWLEQPEDWNDPWPWHPEYNLGWDASVAILVHDVNGNGLNDILVGRGHDYGLSWCEQGREDGQRTWTEHVIDADRSQYHDLQLADIDNDGQLELITGKRYRAHNGNDPGGDEPVGLYYFKIDQGQFRRVTIDYGPAGQASGAGIYFWVADVNDNGRLDIVAPGKEGLFLFLNRGAN